MHIIDKRLRAEQFRHRLGQALQNAGMTQSDLARATRINRSTVSQLLSGTATRLPNAQVIGACAAALRVSADWLLSLSDRPESAADLLSDALSLTTAARALIDEQIFAWHKEAEGFKIRHVPATLPDMFKTPEMLEWEYTPHLGRTSQQAINASNDRLTWMRRSASDYEIALPVYELDSFARAEGYYRGISRQLRVAQIDNLVALCDQFYPRVRIYLFDSRMLYSAPLTIFGPLLSVLYVGTQNVAFRDRDRIQIFTKHFDTLVTQATVSARDLSAHLQQLRQQVV
jgi:transcriptional regulator with XRE-family HTH domain